MNVTLSRLAESEFEQQMINERRVDASTRAATSR